VTITHRMTSLALLATAVALFATGCGDNHGVPGDPGAHADADDHDDHAGHGDAHDDEAGHDDDASHDGDGHEDHAGEDADDGHEGHAGDDAADERDERGEDEGQHVELSPEQRRRIGLELATAAPGSIPRELTFPGEIALNPDQVVHVVPRVAGVVRQVAKTLGDAVAADEALAWIESAELAEAKLDLYAKAVEVGRRRIELPRAKQIFENVNRLLALLEKNPDDEQLSALAGMEMGEYRGNLLTAYAEYVAAQQAVERERTLRGISSDQDLIAAQAGFRRAKAAFDASRDTARFDVFIAFGEAARMSQVAEFDAVAAEQSLRLMGVDDQSMERLLALVPETAELAPCDCPGPDCGHNKFPSVRDTLGKDARLGWYALRAPFAGVVIEKHLTLGEKAGEDEAVFAVADTSTVWANFGVFQKDLADVEPGQSVTVEHVGGRHGHSGAITSVAPLLDPRTRTARARVVLANEDHDLRPGLFVTVRVALPTVEAAVVVPRSAVQILDEREVVFVAEGDGFEAVPVRLGRGDRDVVEVTSGLAVGQRYVKRGAFELKAKVATSGLGAHAGHGH